MSLIRPLSALTLSLLLLWAVKPVAAADKASSPTAQTYPQGVPEGEALDPAAAYKALDLKELVAKSRTEMPGQRIIFVPTAVKFRASLATMPAPQKTEYLMKALGLMRVPNPPKVSQSIGLDYGGEKGLMAYIDETAARRLSAEAKPGTSLLFYAWHVYNNPRGPALIITSFEK